MSSDAPSVATTPAAAASDVPTWLSLLPFFITTCAPEIHRPSALFSSFTSVSVIDPAVHPGVAASLQSTASAAFFEPVTVVAPTRAFAARMATPTPTESTTSIPYSWEPSLSAIAAFCAVPPVTVTTDPF